MGLIQQSNENKEGGRPMLACRIRKSLGTRVGIYSILKNSDWGRDEISQQLCVKSDGWYFNSGTKSQCTYTSADCSLLTTLARSPLVALYDCTVLPLPESRQVTL